MAQPHPLSDGLFEAKSKSMWILSIDHPPVDDRPLFIQTYIIKICKHKVWVTIWVVLVFIIFCILFCFET